MAWDTNVSGRMGAYLPIQQASDENVRSYSKAGANIGKLIGGMVESSQAEKNKALNDTKINELIQKYNDPNDKDFAGMEGSQRALKLSRLLLPYDAEMSKRWEDRSVLMGREMEAGKTDLQKQQITSDTELSKKLIEAQNPPDKEVPATELYKKALGAFRSKTYPQWRLMQSVADQIILPENATEQDIETLVSNSQLAGATLSSDIESNKLDVSGKRLDMTGKQLGSAESAIGLEQAQKDSSGLYKGVPKTLEPIANRIRSVFDSRTNPARSVISEAGKLSATIGSGESGLKGSRAIATVFGFMKALDPTSTVRESEFESVASAQGVYGRLMNILGQVDSGVTLTSDQAKEMKSLAESWANAAKLKIEEERSIAENDAMNNGLNVNNIIGSQYVAKKVNPQVTPNRLTLAPR